MCFFWREGCTWLLGDSTMGYPSLRWQTFQRCTRPYKGDLHVWRIWTSVQGHKNQWQLQVTEWEANCLSSCIELQLGGSPLSAMHQSPSLIVPQRSESIMSHGCILAKQMYWSQNASLRKVVKYRGTHCCGADLCAWIYSCEIAGTNLGVSDLCNS